MLRLLSPVSRDIARMAVNSPDGKMERDANASAEQTAAILTALVWPAVCLQLKSGLAM
jgi:hypothetical protein